MDLLATFNACKEFFLTRKVKRTTLHLSISSLRLLLFHSRWLPAYASLELKRTNEPSFGFARVSLASVF